VLQARAAGLSIFSITDHDTTAGADAAAAPARDAGLELVPGIEISAVADGRDVHMLGYFIDTASPRLREFLVGQRADRLRRVQEIGARLAALGVPVDVAPIAADAARGRSVGRPQIADALVAARHVADRDEAFVRFLEAGGPAFVPRRGARPEEIIGLIHGAGGLASMAHPGITRRDDLLAALAAAGLDALEARHADHDAGTEAHYRARARELGILVTGGSDFHSASAGHRANALGRITLGIEDFEALRSRAAGSR
jgi:predicted metal-dependent phosphoesterase TrpH